MSTNLLFTTKFLISIDSGGFELGRLLRICLKQRPMSLFDAPLEMAQISSRKKVNFRLLTFRENTFNRSLSVFLSTSNINARCNDGILTSTSNTFVFVTLFEKNKRSVDNSFRQINSRCHLTNAVHAIAQSSVGRRNLRRRKV